MADDFALELILADEINRGNGGGANAGDQPRYTDQTVVIEDSGFTTSVPFVIGDSTRSFPLFGVGTVESLLLITDSQSYSIEVGTDVESDMAGEDESTFIDNEDYATLSELSTELGSVSAFQNNEGDYVLSIGPIDFLDTVRAVVRPDGPVTFKRQRAEVTFEREIQ